MRVLLFEPRHKGHHYVYLRRLIPTLATLADPLILTVERDATSFPEFTEHLAPVAGSFTLDSTLAPAPEGFYTPARQRLAELQAAIRRHRPEHIYAPSGDGLVPLSGLDRYTRFFRWSPGTEGEAVLIRASMASAEGGLVRRGKLALLRAATARSPWSRIYTIDSLAYDWVQDRGGALAAKLHLLPDPLDDIPTLDQTQARKLLGLPEGGRYLGCVGAIDRRKGIEFLVPAFAQAGLQPADRLLLAGKPDPEMAAFYQSACQHLVASGRLILLDRYLTDVEMAAAICAVDVVCVPYLQHFGPSGIVIRALAAHRPVLVSDYGWSGHIVPQFNLGQVCHVEDPQAFPQAIRDALDLAPSYVPPPAVHRLVEYLSPANFVATWCQRLRARLCLPPQPLKTWPWVLTGQS